MRCPDLQSVTLDQQSRQAIKEIQAHLAMLKLQGAALATGTLATMFLGNKMPVASFNVSTTDFNAMNNFYQVMDLRARKFIERTASDMYSRTTSNYKLNQFWKAVYHGCKSN